MKLPKIPVVPPKFQKIAWLAIVVGGGFWAYKKFVKKDPVKSVAGPA